MPNPLKLLRAKIPHPRYLKRLAEFYWYHKHVFGVSNTRFDISYCVFQESFIKDQYGIRDFLNRIGKTKEMFFLDIGRNHGLVFCYALYHVLTKRIPVSVINYYGIDPSPLKFVYFNWHDELRSQGITINYHIIDRAVVFDDAKSVRLKYGERNFGNFNVSGSNHSDHLAGRQEQFEYVELIVETIPFSELLELARAHMRSDALVVKIDCKNRTDYMFMQMLEILHDADTNYLVSCERDGSSDRDVSAYVMPGANVLISSRVRPARG